MGKSPARFDGRVALVTGGGTGIGACITEVLSAEGARVVIVQPDQSSADELAGRLRADGTDVRGVGADLASAAACRAAVASCIGLHGRIDILVNNAAVTGEPATGDLLDFPDAQLDAIIDVNLKAAFRCSRDAARLMAGYGGVIVNIASVGAFAAQHRSTAYVASKAAIVGMTRGMAFELAPHGIRVAAIAPGDIDVSGGSDVTGHGSRPPGNPYDAGTREWWERRSPLGRRGAPSDIARAVAFLCSDEAGYITGETLVVDGGWLSY
jgi:NAD(P)-dependent dehydrogenase (short-subunit alcohol dehydrogenase family)